MSTTELSVMAKAKGRPKKPGGEGTTVRIDSDVATKAKYLAARRDLALSELLTAYLRPIVERDFQKAAKELITEE